MTCLTRVGARLVVTLQQIPEQRDGAVVSPLLRLPRH
jgi:hypothetical protein